MEQDGLKRSATESLAVIPTEDHERQEGAVATKREEPLNTVNEEAD